MQKLDAGALSAARVGLEALPAAQWLAELILFLLPVGVALLLAKAWRKLRPA